LGFARFSNRSIDLLYNFCDNVGEIEGWNYNGELKLTPKGRLNFEDKFDDELQFGLMTLAKHTLKTEIEYNLKGVVPVYDTDLMLPK